MHRCNRILRGRKPYNQLSARQRQRITNELRNTFRPDKTEAPDSFQSSSSSCQHTHENRTNSQSYTSLAQHDCESDSSDNFYEPKIDEPSGESSDEDCNRDFFDENMSCSDESEDHTEATSSIAQTQCTAIPSDSFREKLASCFVENDITHVAGNAILAVLRSHECFASLPKTTRTLLDTPRQPVELVNVTPGQYLHLGFEIAIIGILKEVAVDCIPAILQIDFSTDGASPDKSGINQTWPIQCRIANIERSRPGVIGVYWGTKKPTSAMDFMRPFVEEANEIIRNGGVLFSQTRIPINLRAFIADAPARAFILNHKGHNSSSACSKCKIQGTYLNSRMTFATFNAVPRSNEEYERRTDSSHHFPQGSPLSLLSIGLVTQVPFEYQHLICLGVMKRLLMAWVDGKFSKEAKLSAHQISIISARLKSAADHCPREFSRFPRDLSEYRLYHATELRQFLLYTGPNAVRGILKDNVFTHFLLLHVAIRILATPDPTQAQLLCAEEALKTFVVHSESIYGVEFITYNVHGLLHVVDDVKRFGPIDTYSTFPYENNMKIFRKYCRKPHLPLQQIANRIAEKVQWYHKSNRHRKHSRLTTETFRRHNNGPVPTGITDCRIAQYSRIEGPKFTLDLSKRNNCCITQDNSVCLIYNIAVFQSSEHLIVRRFKSVSSLFHVIIPSSSIGYHKCSQLEEELTLVRFDNVATKGYLLPTWVPDYIDENNQELQSNEEFVVVGMSCAAQY